MTDEFHPARRTDPDTAKHAAVANPKQRTAMRWRILLWFRAHPEGATDYTLSVAMGLQRGTAARRRKDLEQSGFVAYSGRKGVTDTGSSARIYAITSSGWEKAAQL